MSTMNYRGYHARITFEEDDGVFVGRIAGIRDRILFEGESVDELENAFRGAVDDYLETCAARGKEPQKPYSGRMMLRITPERHAKAALAAELSGLSLTKWVERAIDREADVA